MTILVEESTNQADKCHWTENKVIIIVRKRAMPFKPATFCVYVCDVNEVDVLVKLLFTVHTNTIGLRFQLFSTLDRVFKCMRFP